jgi:hypothetical protein
MYKCTHWLPAAVVVAAVVAPEVAVTSKDEQVVILKGVVQRDVTIVEGGLKKDQCCYAILPDRFIFEI